MKMYALHVRTVLFPRINRELQSRPRGSLQVHPGGLQDRSDEGGGTNLPREQLL